MAQQHNKGHSMTLTV